MKITEDNIKNVLYFAGLNTQIDSIESCQNLLSQLVIDLNCMNNSLTKKLRRTDHELYIDYIDQHTQYSPERTDPCPDYYGLFRLRSENNDAECVGSEMTIYELDAAISILCDFENLI